MMGRRKMTKFRFRILVLVYIAMGCIIPYYIMKHVDEQLYQEGLVEQRAGEATKGDPLTMVENEDDLSDAPTVGYKRRAFFEDLVGNMAQRPISDNDEWRHPRQPNAQQPPLRPPSSHESSHTLDSILSPLIQRHRNQRVQRHRQLLETMDESFTLLREQNKMIKVKTRKQYRRMINNAIQLTREFLHNQLPSELIFEQDRTRIPGTGINTPEKTAQFRELMDQALNQGRWVYEADRDYPDFGGATAWSKKKQNERDRDVAIDRAPFPQAGKYHWEPRLTNRGRSDMDSTSVHSIIPWYANRIQPEDFCRILGPRHIVLAGDLIHWQLHDSIMYNMFDTPQICYGDMACHQGVGHPLCPLPNDVRLKFVRNDLLSPVRQKTAEANETRTHHPVEMAWLKDLKLKDTVILGAPHHVMKDQHFRKRLVQTLLKIRAVRPEALVIYRNNPIGHPDCPSKFNKFNRPKKNKKSQKGSLQVLQPPSLPRPEAWLSNRTTFGVPARPLKRDIPIEEILEYPLNWSHYDRQNEIAKVLVEAAGGIYWNVATMTNRRPDGHVGGHDCLTYRRPGPTDEWAVSLYNLFKTIERVEQATSSP